VEQIIVTVRFAEPEDGDPGEAAVGYYTVEDGLLTMTDEHGTPLKNSMPVKLEDPSKAQAIAASLVKKRRNDPENFNRPLRYSRGCSVA
jgi:hypothetical protein